MANRLKSLGGFVMNPIRKQEEIGKLYQKLNELDPVTDADTYSKIERHIVDLENSRNESMKKLALTIAPAIISGIVTVLCTKMNNEHNSEMHRESINFCYSSDGFEEEHIRTNSSTRVIASDIFHDVTKR